MLRKAFIATVASAGLAAPAFAADAPGLYAPPSNDLVYQSNSMVTGHVALSFGTFDEDESGFLYIAGRGNVNFGSWNLGLEVAGAGFFEGDAYVGTYAHLWTRSLGPSVGIFGGVATGFGDPLITVGVEAEAYYNSFTVGGQVAYNTVNSHDFWLLRAYADFYLTQNDAITGDIQWISDFYSGGSLLVLTGAYEHRFAGTPFTGYVAGSWLNPEHGDDGWSVQVGTRLIFDQPGGTLYDQNIAVPFNYVATVF